MTPKYMKSGTIWLSTLQTVGEPSGYSGPKGPKRTLCNCDRDSEYNSDDDPYGRDEYTLPLCDGDGGWYSSQDFRYGSNGGGKERGHQIAIVRRLNPKLMGRALEDFEVDDVRYSLMSMFWCMCQ